MNEHYEIFRKCYYQCLGNISYAKLALSLHTPRNPEMMEVCKKSIESLELEQSIYSRLMHASIPQEKRGNE